jgi:hypothetical protein
MNKERKDLLTFLALSLTASLAFHVALTMSDSESGDAPGPVNTVQQSLAPADSVGSVMLPPQFERDSVAPLGN